MRSQNRPIFPALIVGIISIPIFVGALDLTVVSAVLPQVIYDLEIPYQTGLDDAAWIVTGYLLAYSVAMTFMGRLSDLYGRRRVYLLALVIFAIGSYLVAVAEAWPTRVALRSYYLLFTGRPDPARVTLLMLIIARMIQAFGGGAMVPVGMALVGDLYPAGERAKPLGIIAAVDTAGWAVGHYYGGIVTYHLDWRTIFWLNLPICALAFIFIYLVLRRLPQKPFVQRMDWLGATLITLALMALKLANHDGCHLINRLKQVFTPLFTMKYSATNATGYGYPYPIVLLWGLCLFLRNFHLRLNNSGEMPVELAQFTRNVAVYGWC